MTGNNSSPSSDTTLPLPTMMHMLTLQLKSTNYMLWINQVASVFSIYDVLGYVDGTIVCPSAKVVTADGATVDNPAYAEWRKKDQSLRSLLIATLSEEAMTETIGCTTSRSVWEALAAAFCPNTTQHALSLKEELRSLQRGDKSVSEFGREFKALSDQLSVLNQPVDEAEKSHWFLRGLGPAFSSFSAAQMTLDPLPTFKVLLPRAINFLQFEHSMQPTPGAHVAFAANRGRPQQSNVAPRYAPVQPRIGRVNHNNAQGNNNGQNTKGNSRGTPRRHPLYCRKCGYYGHTADRCDGRYLQPTHQNSANLAEAFNASCNVNYPQSDWFIDSGASAHMTPTPENLDTTTSYTGNDQVLVGNDSGLGGHSGQRKA